MSLPQEEPHWIESGAEDNDGTPPSDATFDTGAGGGIYSFVASFGLQVDIAYGSPSDSVNVHTSTGFRY